MAPFDEIEGLIRFSIEIRPNHVYVWQGGQLMDPSDAERLQREVEEAMGVASLKRALFDNRATKAPEASIRDLMWRWITQPQRFERVAIVLASVDRRQAANERAETQPVEIRAFEDLDRARAWLESP